MMKATAVTVVSASDDAQQRQVEYRWTLPTDSNNTPTDRENGDGAGRQKMKRRTNDGEWADRGAQV